MNLFNLKHLMHLEEKYRGQPNCFEKIVAQFPAFCKKVCAYFTVSDLKYLHKSGRLGGAAAFIGSVLDIKPIITTSEDGKLVTLTKKKGRLQSMQFIASQVAKIDPDFSEVYIIHADCAKDAEILKQKVLEINGTVNVEILNMGFIIGTHTGPGTLGLGFKAK